MSSRLVAGRVGSRFASERARSLPRSPFLVMDAAKARARDAGREVVDLSIGSSDLPPPAAALEALRAAALDAGTYEYSLYRSTLPLRAAAARWMNGRFGLNLTPEHTLALIGSQEGLAHLLLALTDPGDVVLAPDPAYPSYFGAFALAGVEMHPLPLEPERGFLPDLAAVPDAVARRARLLLLNYPNNPTAAVATREFWREAVAFCARHDLVLVHDFPYSETTFEGEAAPSALEVPGALERTVELFSLSKAHHMGGFRVGWAAGGPELVGLLAAAKAPVDFNPYLGIQRAAVAALESGPGRVRADALRLRDRRDTLVGALAREGWAVPVPAASMYVWAPLPGAWRDSFAFCEALCAATGVALAPGRGFGERGEGFARFALVREPAALEAAAARIGAFLREHADRPGGAVGRPAGPAGGGC